MNDWSYYREKITDNLELVKANVKVTEDVISDLLQQTYALFGSKEETDYNLCLAVVCHVADKLTPLDSFNQQLLEDCIKQSRVYLYGPMLSGEAGTDQYSLLDEFARAYYTMPKTGTILTRDQKRVYDSFTQNRRIVLSAPTSFGKTRVLEEILANNEYRLCVLIFPTIALLAEQFKKLKGNPHLVDYQISTSSKVVLDTTNHRYILLFTPERLSLFLSTENNRTYSFDFFSVDEVYKADQRQEEDRHYFFADTLYNLAKFNPTADFYLLGPYINSFSQVFIDKFGATLLKFRAEVVQKDYFKLSDMRKDVGFSGFKGISGKKKLLAQTIATLTEKRQQKNLVFCGSKSNTKVTAKIAAEAVSYEGYEATNKELCKYISDNISPQWGLIDFIKRGVAYHNSAMPRHVQELIVDAFENKGGSLHTLTCTTTLTEGVNTSAKNIIFYDHKIQGASGDVIDTFVRKNIEGRAGRLAKHFIGNIYYLDRSIDQVLNKDEGEMSVGLEYFDSEDPSPEAVLQVEKEDLSDTNSQMVVNIETLCSNNDIPLSLVKLNKFIPVQKQVEAVKMLRTSQLEVSFDDYQSLRKVFEFTHDNLFNKRDQADEFTRQNYLISKSVGYAMSPKPLKQMIEDDLWRRRDREPDPDKIIGDAIKFHYKFVEYAWPRYLTVFGRLYNYVRQEKGKDPLNFDTLVARMEYGSSEEHEILLREAGLPAEIIKKVQSRFRDCKTPEEIYRVCERDRTEIESVLSPIEYRVFSYYL